MAKTNLYKGYSSFEFQKNRTFKLTDIELVKMDLLNHIFTRKGERVMMSDFGTLIPDLVFEPMDEENLDILESELRRVIDYDPRVELLSFVLSPDYDTNTVTAHIKIRYVELNITDNFDLNIEFEGSR